MLGNLIRSIGLNPGKLHEWFRMISLDRAACQQNLLSLSRDLTRILPDISDQYTGKHILEEYPNMKSRLMHAFQIRLAIRSLEKLKHKDSLVVVDIGDSSGNHILYLRSIVQGPAIDSISVNLDSEAVKLITEKGLEAVCVRAEDLDIDGDVDVYMSFETLEHLTDPVRFLHRLATRGSGNRLVLTVPYRRRSQVGLKHLRPPHDTQGECATAENAHIFELSPQDWGLLFRHAGWEIDYEEIYYQYPRRHPLTFLLKRDWLSNDFEGFLGVILKKNLASAERYLSW